MIVWGTYVFNSPQHHQPLQQAGLRRRSAREEIYQPFRGGLRLLGRHLQTILALRVFEELQLLLHVANGRAEEIQGTEGRVLGQVADLGDAGLVDQAADKGHDGAGDVDFLGKPLVERRRRECATSGVGQKRLLRSGRQTILHPVQEMGGERWFGCCRGRSLVVGGSTDRPRLIKTTRFR